VLMIAVLTALAPAALPAPDPCDAGLRRAATRQGAKPRKLGDEPNVDRILTVLRRDAAGCPRPVRVREDIGGNPRP